MGKTIRNILAPGAGLLDSFLTPDRPKMPRSTSKTDVDKEAARAAEEERDRLRRARGRASTVLTGPLGDVSAPSLGKKVLTGE